MSRRCLDDRRPRLGKRPRSRLGLPVPIHRPIHLPVHLPIHLPVHLPIHLPVHLPIGLLGLGERQPGRSWATQRVAVRNRELVPLQHRAADRTVVVVQQGRLVNQLLETGRPRTKQERVDLLLLLPRVER